MDASGPDFDRRKSQSAKERHRFGLRPKLALVPCLFAATALLLAWRSLVEVPIGTYTQPGPGWWPLVICVILLGVSLLAMLEGEPREELLGEVDGGQPAVRGGPFLILSACVFAALAIEPLGYRPTTLLILLFFLGVVERRHPLAALAVAGFLSFGSYAVLVGLLRLRLPVGLLGI